MMECTQKLECTQELYASQCERTCPEQIGFLGICGKKYPVKRGPNKIGRDPLTCSIVLNLNSISRQHAVINILNGTEYMLMDLDSANKTKLDNKTLQPYIPHHIKNGDTVQFGEVFGIFRLLEEDSDLPMTQALDIPDTPVFSRHATRSYNVPTTTIPESPDISDRDDSFIIPSQPKGPTQFKSPSNRYKSTPKTIAIKPVASNKIGSGFWSTSKKSTSINLDDSSSSINDSVVSVRSEDDNTIVKQINNDDIHEMETQPPLPNEHYNCTDSIYTAETQIPTELNASPSIHSLDTQLPVPIEYLPEVCKINDQQEMQINLYDMANKENDNSVFNAETQFPAVEPVYNVRSSIEDDVNSIFNAETQFVSGEMKNKDIRSKTTEYDDSIFNAKTQLVTMDNKQISPLELENNNSLEKLNKSDDEILFDDIDSQSFADDFDSQPLLPPEPCPDQNNVEIFPLSQTIMEDHDVKVLNSVKRDTRIDSHGSTDCEDFNMLPTQKVSDQKVDDELTDCEDDISEKDKPNKHINVVTSSPKLSFEDMPTQVIENDVIETVQSVDNVIKETDFEDMPTQVIPGDEYKKEIAFEDLPTQVIDSDVPNEAGCITEEPTQDYSEEMISPFKIPIHSLLKFRRKETNKLSDIKIKSSPEIKKTTNVVNNDDDKYYEATQDIFDDLCSQKEYSPEIINTTNTMIVNTKFSAKQEPSQSSKSDEEILPCSVENYKIGARFPHLENELSPTKKYPIEKSFESSEGDEKINKFVSSLSSKQIRDVIGVEPIVSKLKRVSSDPSDTEVTPKKMRPFKLLEIDLPNSQEIKTSVSLNSKTPHTESSSESEAENDSQEHTPILFRKKKRIKAQAKVDLTKIFDAHTLPTRIITRLRKPTSKIEDSDEETKKRNKNILKPKFLTEQDDDIDKEIICENISRLKNKTEKKNNKDAGGDIPKSAAAKNERTSPKVSENKIEVSEKHESRETSEYTNTRKNKHSKNETEKGNNDETVKKILSKSILITNESIIKKTDKPKGTLKETRKKRQSENKVTNAKLKKNKDNELAKKIGENDARESDKSKCRSRETDDVEMIEIAEVTTKVLKEIEAAKDTSESEVKPKRKSRESRMDKKSEVKESKDKDKTISKTNAAKASTSKQIAASLDSTTKTSNLKKTRNSRNKPKDASITNKEKFVSFETGKAEEKRPREKRTNKKQYYESSPEETEVRRSKRQKATKDKNESIGNNRNKSILKKPSFELSNVYSVSSESSAESSNGKKRSAVDNVEVGSPKRARYTGKSTISLRATPARNIRIQHVLFTAFSDDDVRVKLEKLGAVMVSDVKACTVVLTKQIKRTFKLLCAVGLGRPIVGPAWVQACFDNNTIVDPRLYLIEDSESERRFGFSLSRTLAGRRGFLRGYHVSATPCVQPCATEMKLIVECSGGTWKAAGPQWVCVSCGADRALWAGLRAKGATLVTTEFILGGVLRQQADLTTNAIHF